MTDFEEYEAKPFAGKKIDLPNEEWHRLLKSDQYHVLREAGTEHAFSGELCHQKEEGEYLCTACGLPLFSSDAKFESGSGWPSFYEPIDPSHVGYQLDHKLGTERVEVHCNRCDGHLGHVFKDGPPPTGYRYCINAIALQFLKR